MDWPALVIAFSLLIGSFGTLAVQLAGLKRFGIV
jgi:hypothetical protein